MHFQAITLLGLTALATARRSVRHGMKNSNSGGELAEKARATAYRIDEHGAATIECWEIGAFIPKPSSTTSGAVSQFSIADQNSLASVVISSLAPGTELKSSNGDMAAMFSEEFKPALVSVKSGMLEVQSQGFADGSRSDVSTEEDGYDSHIFADINGDDWFYFEDASTSALLHSKNEDIDIVLKTRSGDVTSVITFSFDESLEHKKLHEGACDFAGLKTSAGSAFDKDIAGSDAKGDLGKQGL